MRYKTDDYVELCWKKARGYMKAVLDGKITTNKWIKLAKERFQEDLDRDDLLF